MAFASVSVNIDRPAPLPWSAVQGGGEWLIVDAAGLAVAHYLREVDAKAIVEKMNAAKENAE